RKTVSSALDYVENNKALATIGIPPARPETGYGYIKVESPFDNNPEFSEIKPVLRFLEKPDSLTARKFISTGKLFWNSGMFFWRLDTFIEEMTACLPDVGLKIKDMSEKYIRKTNIAHSEPLHTIDGIFELMPNISIDYGLMEKAGDVVVARALFEWDDIGSWDSLSRTKPKDDRGNVVEGVVCLVDSNNSIIINSTEGNKTIVSALGLDGIVIVATDDAIVVCPKDRVQDVKKCVEEIRNAYQEKWI
ncbi:MAG: mannose-phosphate guanylyltransferase, partial [Bacteroidota bacterium]|nr:mannose-phosphate guanylyltransferase [Bacteroidota bacterium]